MQSTGSGARARPRGLLPLARPVWNAFAARVEAALASAAPREVPETVARELLPLLGRADLLAPEHAATDPACYRRHLLYADPGGRFTVLALAWLPGQRTSIHGHTAWGAVGVHQGAVVVERFEGRRGAAGPEVVQALGEASCQAGTVTTARPGLGDAHRIRNDGPGAAVTLHVYGRDLVDDPSAINLVIAP